VTRAGDVRAMIGDTIAAYGRLDCAFNNAGIAPSRSTPQARRPRMVRRILRPVIAVNLKGVWLCMKEELPQMQKQGGGAIVKTASIAGLIGLVTSSAYVVASTA